MKFRDIIKPLLLVASLALVTSLTNAQSSVYPGTLASAPTPAYGEQPVIVPTPFFTLGLGAYTNLSGGWTNSTILTNITTLWNSSSNAFVSVTNTVTNSVVSYATIDVRSQRYMPLQFEGQFGGAATGAVVFVLAPSTTGVNFSSAKANQIVTGVVSQGNAGFTWSTNIDAMGWPFWRIMYITNGDAGFYLTNNGVYSTSNPRNGK